MVWCFVLVSCSGLLARAFGPKQKRLGSGGFVVCVSRPGFLWFGFVFQVGLFFGLNKKATGGVQGCHSHRERHLLAFSNRVLSILSSSWGRNKPMSKKMHKPNAHKIVPGLSWDRPSIFLRYPRKFVYVFPFSPTQRQHISNFDPHPFPGQSRKVDHVYCFFVSRSSVRKTKQKYPGRW